jgi:hypothetical protein
LASLRVLALQREARIEHHLLMLNLAVLHVSACLHHLKPPQVAQGLVGTLDCRLASSMLLVDEPTSSTTL